MNSNYFVIDAHCHIYPDKIAEKAARATDAFYEIEGAHDGRVSTLLCEGERGGIDHFLVQSVATTPKQVSSINHFIAETVAASGGKMTGLGTLHPDSDDLARDVEEIIALGLRGVKLHPDIQRFPLDDVRAMRIYELCEGRLPILIHTGDYRYDYSNPNRLIPVLTAFPRLTVIGAHLGGWSIWKEASEKLAGIPNLYYDCSSCFGFGGVDGMRGYIEHLGTDRVLFGSDYPMWNPGRELEIFFSLGFPEDVNRQILSENAKRLFGLEL